MKIKKFADVPTPFYAKPGDAGLDLVAALEQRLTVQPGEVVKVPTGIAVEIPPGWAGLLMPRSSTKGLMLTNAVGLIDSGYRGEIIAQFRNVTSDPVFIEPLIRLVQLVLVPILRVSIVVVDELEPSERGAGGFGSTGQ